MSNRLEVSNVFFGTESGDMAGYEAFQLVVSFLQDLHLRERDRPEVSASELGVEAASVYQYIAHLITVTFGRTITDGTAVSAHGSNLSHITGGQGTRWFHSDSVRMVFRCRISGRELDSKRGGAQCVVKPLKTSFPTCISRPFKD